MSVKKITFFISRIMLNSGNFVFHCYYCIIPQTKKGKYILEIETIIFLPFIFYLSLYRVSHETWQLVNGFECLLPYVILDIKDFFQFISLTNSFTQIYFTLKSICYKMTAMLYFLLFSFVSKNLTNYGRRHLKLFTNCHVSWGTLYLCITAIWN